MKPAPVYIFKNQNSTLINEVPINGTVIVIDYFGETRILTKLSNHGLTSNSTISEFLSDESRWKLLGKPSELEKIEENGHVGWRIYKRDPNNFGDIGEGAFDFSNNETPSNEKGATGTASFALNGFDPSTGAWVGVTALGKSSIASGVNTKALGDVSTTFGERTEASGKSSIASGADTKASGDKSVTFGKSTEATGESSIASGVNTKASGEASVAFGRGSVASGDFSVSEGLYTTVLVEKKEYTITIPEEIDPNKYHLYGFELNTSSINLYGVNSYGDVNLYGVGE